MMSNIVIGIKIKRYPYGQIQFGQCMGRSQRKGHMHMCVCVCRLEKVANNHKQTTIGKIKNKKQKKGGGGLFNNGFPCTMGG